ncbi:MAG: aldehyde dehydrogenase family protein [Terrimicrobiaceae bacterium]
MSDPRTWRNRSPGDLSVALEEQAAGDVAAAVERSVRAAAGWRNTSLEQRKAILRDCQNRLRDRQEDLARLIALEVGKPLREARLELGAVIAKFDLTFADADRFVADQAVEDGPHPALVRRRARGPAAVIAPFNFPIHLGHGAAVAYLLAGNTVLFKPSPLAAGVGAAYAREMSAVLPAGVFELVQGWGESGRELCLHPAVRSVCFTGSVPVGTALAKELAADYSKSLALELGGINSLIVCADADLDLAAAAAADGLCLTTGQRCNATSRIFLEEKIAAGFVERFLKSLDRYQPGDPLDEGTFLGPLVSQAAVQRHAQFVSSSRPKLLAGEVCLEVNGKAGNYVRPVVFQGADNFWVEEAFCPVAVVRPFSTFDEVLRHQSALPHGLTASIFTSSEETFHRMGESLEVGNLYWNLPTTFSPSTLPFGGLRASGNGKPGGRGFIRFAADEQAVQWLRQ